MLRVVKIRYALEVEFYGLASFVDSSYLPLVLVCFIQNQIRYCCSFRREDLLEHSQCIYRFACFSCDGRIHGPWYIVCVCVCMCVCPVSRRRNGTTLLRTGGTGASVAVGSHQASPNQECSSVSAAATFAVRMIYPDTRTTASPNSYHRRRRWMGFPKVQRCVGVCVCLASL